MSELAKSNHKSSQQGADHTNTPALARIIAVALAAGALTWGSVPGVSWAAVDTTPGNGNGVAIGTGSNAPKAEKAENVAIGKGAEIKYSNGASSATGDVIVGSGAVIDNYASQGGSIAIGKNATIENMTGMQESLFSLGQTRYHDGNWLGTVQIPDNPENVAGSIALGDNTYARTGSIMIGSHNYRGLIGDQTVDTSKTKGYVKTKDYGININATTLGTNSFNQGAFSSVTGAYSIISGKYNGRGFSPYGAQNFGATITGSLNSIESATSSSIYSGIANSIVGTANRTFNSNGSLIFGAGNEIKNSITDISAPTSGGDSAKALQDSLMKAVQESKSGGATLVIGGGNKADYTQKTQILGVNNTVTGTEKNISDYNMIDGFGNTITGASHLYTIGTNNKVTSTTNSQIFGDNRAVTGADGAPIDGAVIIGSASGTTPMTTDKKNVTILGYNANATVEGGVALGAGSVASGNKDVVGYDAANVDHSGDTTGVWKSKAAAVSVGDKDLTRQITNVAAGKEDTDAVNVAQLKAAQTHFYSVNSDETTAGNYNNDGAKGKNALAAGVGALATGNNSVAIGTNAKAQNDALAVGESANAGNNGIAIGMHANAGYGQNMALGYYASVANGVSNSTALGYGSQVTKRDILQSDGSDGVVSVGKSVGQSGEKGMTRRIINVKAGVNDTDAVNVSQLKQRAQAATTEVAAGTNIASVTKNDKTADGHTIYTVNAKGTTVSGDDNFNITSKTYDATNVTDYAISLKNTITIGSGTGTHPITINGTDGVVSGLTNTTWDKNADYSKSTKAATEAQLQRAMKDAQEAAEANDTDTHVKAGTYAVTTVKDAAGKDTQGVALDVVDKTGTSVGKVTITDVAKASDVGDVSQLSKEVQNTEGSTTVVDAINNVNTKVNTVDNKVGDLNYSSTNYVKSGDNVTTSISNLDKAIHDATTEAGKHSTVSAGNNIKVTPDTTDGKTDYKVSLSDDINVNSVTAKTVTTDNLTVNKSATIGKVTINADDKGTIGGLTNKTWDAKNITSGQAATEDQLQAATKNAVNYDGDSSKTITLREDTTIKNVANTAIEQGSKNAVNAGTVYNETRVKQDGKYVKASNTAGENLSVLDNQVASNSSNITNLNGRVNNLDSKVNKVGAGAAALAALHPLDFDPEDKWDFAVGYGNYRDANSVAVGAFYRPDEDTMFSVGTNFGNGENMINAGVSFKFGPKGKSQVRPGSTQEITELRATVARQDDQLKKQDSEIKELKAMVQQLLAAQDKKAATK